MVERRSQPHPNASPLSAQAITGSTAAFTLAEAGRLQPRGSPQITIFERNSIIGSRIITTTQAFGDPRLTTETCAAAFSLVDGFCLSTTAANVGLSPTPLRQNSAGVGIWNGKGFRGFIEDERFRVPQTWSLARKLRWFQRYGYAPWYFDQRVTTFQSKFRFLGRHRFRSPGIGSQAEGFEKGREGGTVLEQAGKLHRCQ